MLKIEIEKTIYYTYELTEEEQNEIRRIISENKDGIFDYGTYEENVAKAFEILDQEIGTNIFQNDDTVETETMTNDFRYSEFNECSAEEFIDGKEP